MSTPFRIDLDKGGGHFPDPHLTRHRPTHLDLEIDTVRAWHITAGQNRFTDLGALFIGEGHAAARIDPTLGAALFRASGLGIAIILGLPTILTLARVRIVVASILLVMRGGLI
jgi:hypothetical protein